MNSKHSDAHSWFGNGGAEVARHGSARWFTRWRPAYRDAFAPCAGRVADITDRHKSGSWRNLNQWAASDILARFLAACLVATMPQIS
jgi:hypothetical protein